VKKYILTFELRYTIHKEDDQDYSKRKFTIGEFLEFNEAVKVGNQFIDGLKLDHASTPGINGDRLGTPIFGTIKNNLIRNYLRNNKGQKLAEIFIKISTVNCVDLENALQICDKFKSIEVLTADPLTAN
jgi:hypothetical protein